MTPIDFNAIFSIPKISLKKGGDFACHVTLFTFLHCYVWNLLDFVALFIELQFTQVDLISVSDEMKFNGFLCLDCKGVMFYMRGTLRRMQTGFDLIYCNCENGLLMIICNLTESSDDFSWKNMEENYIKLRELNRKKFY